MHLRRSLVALSLLLAASPAVVAAQDPSDSVFRRAEQLVRQGQGTAGRAIVDSVLGAAPSTSPAYAEALYWRAVLAPSAADAERDLQRVVVEFAAHPRTEDATLRLAQLELARGDRERALLHLQRFEREHAGSPQRARAAFLLARLHLDGRDMPRGCAALGTARAAVRAEDAELRNQIDYYAPRCEGVDTTRVATNGAREAVRGEREAVRGARNATDEARPPRPASRAPQTAARPAFTIQVAAFNTRDEAQSLVDVLRQRTLEGRVVGDAKPFRVRIGHYATRAAANEALRALKAKKLNGYVTATERETAP